MTRSTNISLLKFFFGKIYSMLFFIFNHTPLPSPYLPKAIAQVGLLTFSFLLFPSYSSAQTYVPADPFYLLSIEKEQYKNADSLQISSTIIRPFYIPHKKGQLTIRYRHEQYSNDNTSNQENMDIRFMGKGRGWFQGLNISYYNDFIAFSVEPYWLSSANDSAMVISRSHMFSALNDSHIKPDGQFISSGFREAQIYLHFKGLGVGISNASMWWGPGIHSTLSMTNNTEGFFNYMLGTIRELRWGKGGLNFRYTLGQLNEETGNDATYFTALTGVITYHGSTELSIGLSRNYLSGGYDVGMDWTMQDAANLIWEALYVEDKVDYPYTPIWGHDPWDQTMSGFVSISIPASGFNVFLELGTNDHRASWGDLLTQPDHAIATIIGFRKYGFFDHPDLVLGFEYARLIQAYSHVFRISPNWYGRDGYDYSSYEGRRWAAHSGADSDDFLLFFGYMGDKWSFIPGFNYERHGVIYTRVPEVKMEFRLDTRYKYKDVWFNLYYEYQHEQHLGFTKDNVYLDEATGLRFTNTIMLGIEKIIYF